MSNFVRRKRLQAILAQPDCGMWRFLRSANAQAWGERALAGQQARALLIFAVVIGFIAGLTFETVYRRLARVDVIRIDALNQR
jgi:hypothetical protein